jgi:NADPH-dependent curcumin reductase CurA
VVGQIAKIKGCRVVGIAGGEQKCHFVTEELWFDACLDHRDLGLGENLKAACPEGIDIYFDYASQFPDFVTDMKAWLAEGRIKYREDITEGLENAPRELIRLLKGENFGKKIIQVSPDP